MEFLVGFDVTIPDGTPESEVKERVGAEATAAASLAREGHLVRLWRPLVALGESTAVGLYRADSEAELDGLLGALPLNGWMQITVTPLEPHPNDPTSPRPSSFQLPDPRLTPIYRLEATLGEPVDLGDTGHGHRRIGAGLVAGYRRAGYAVVGVALSLPSSDEDNTSRLQATSLTPQPRNVRSTKPAIVSGGSGEATR